MSPRTDASYGGRICTLETLELVFETAGRAQTDDRRQVERQNGRGAELQAGAERLGDQGLSRIHGLLAVFKRLQHGYHEGGVAG